MICTKCKLHKFTNTILDGEYVKYSGRLEMLFITVSPTNSHIAIKEALNKKEKILMNKLLDDVMNETGVIIGPVVYTFMVHCVPKSGITEPRRDPIPEEIIKCSLNNWGDKKIKDLKNPLVFFMGSEVERYYIKHYTRGKAIQPLDYLLQDGGRSSSWYNYNLRTIIQAVINAKKART